MHHIKFSISLHDDQVAKHCPCCGGPLDIIQQEFHHNGIDRSFNMYTCWAEQCPVFGRTCSNRDLIAPEVLEAWEAVQRFDVFSGLSLELEEAHS